MLLDQRLGSATSPTRSSCSHCTVEVMTPELPLSPLSPWTWPWRLPPLPHRKEIVSFLVLFSQLVVGGHPGGRNGCGFAEEVFWQPGGLQEGILPLPNSLEPGTLNNPGWIFFLFAFGLREIKPDVWSSQAFLERIPAFLPSSPAHLLCSPCGLLGPSVAKNMFLNLLTKNTSSISHYTEEL